VPFDPPSCDFQRFKGMVTSQSVVPVAYMSASVPLCIVSCLDFHLSWLLAQLPAAFRKVLEFDGPASMVAIPAFNKLIVHCESTLFSYPLDIVVRVYRGDAASKALDGSVEWISREHGPVSFLKVGRSDNRTVGEWLLLSNVSSFLNPR